MRDAIENSRILDFEVCSVRFVESWTRATANKIVAKKSVYEYCFDFMIIRYSNCKLSPK